LDAPTSTTNQYQLFCYWGPDRICPIISLQIVETPTIGMAKEMTIDLSKITLRPYKISDADDFLMYGGDDKVTRFTRWNTFTSMEEALSYIKDYCIPHPYCRSICIADRSIGFIIIVPKSGGDRCRADVGYALAAEQ
jgi:RimJ/RimL family protein N-acetyltransferase